MANHRGKSNNTAPQIKDSKEALALTKKEMIYKMLADQQYIREAIQSNISFKELKEKHGYKLATV